MLSPSCFQTRGAEATELLPGRGAAEGEERQDEAGGEGHVPEIRPSFQNVAANGQDRKVLNIGIESKTLIYLFQFVSFSARRKSSTSDAELL